MSQYKVGLGHDVALDDLELIDPQPRCDGIQAARRTYAASGTVVEEGFYVELVWDVLEDAGAYQDLLAEFDVWDNLTAAVTLWVRDESYTYVRVNGTAVRPESGRERQWRDYFPRAITILVRDITGATPEA